jgi:hypothetical protein
VTPERLMPANSAVVWNRPMTAASRKASESSRRARLPVRVVRVVRVPTVAARGRRDH